MASRRNTDAHRGQQGYLPEALSGTTMRLSRSSTIALPPLVTPALRQEMQRYREQAIAVEKKLAERAKELAAKKCMAENCEEEPERDQPGGATVSFTSDMKMPFSFVNGFDNKTFVVDKESLETLEETLCVMSDPWLCSDSGYGQYGNMSLNDTVQGESLSYIEPCDSSDSIYMTPTGGESFGEGRRMRRGSYTLESPSEYLLANRRRFTVDDGIMGALGATDKCEVDITSYSDANLSQPSFGPDVDSTVILDNQAESSLFSGRDVVGSLDANEQGAAQGSVMKLGVTAYPLEIESIWDDFSATDPEPYSTYQCLATPASLEGIEDKAPESTEEGRVPTLKYREGFLNNLSCSGLMEKPSKIACVLSKEDHSATSEKNCFVDIQASVSKLQRQMQEDEKRLEQEYQLSRMRLQQRYLEKEKELREELQKLSLDSYSLPMIMERGSSDIMPDFDKVTAAAKGYLTRRLLACQKVQMILSTIKESTLHLSAIDQEIMMGGTVKILDVHLYRQLLVQMTSARKTLWDIFHCLSATERMALIARDRQWIVSGRIPSQEHQAKPLTKATIASMRRRSYSAASELSAKEAQGCSHRRSSESSGYKGFIHRRPVSSPMVRLDVASCM